MLKHKVSFNVPNISLKKNDNDVLHINGQEKFNDDGDYKLQALLIKTDKRPMPPPHHIDYLGPVMECHNCSG